MKGVNIDVGFYPKKIKVELGTSCPYAYWMEWAD